MEGGLELAKDHVQWRAVVSGVTSFSSANKNWRSYSHSYSACHDMRQ